MIKAKINLLSFLTLNLLLISNFFVNNIFAQNFAPKTTSLDNFSNAPVVTIGGFVNSSAGFRDQSGAFGDSRLPDAVLNSSGQVDTSTDPYYPGTQNTQSNEYDFANDSELHIKAAGISEYGTKYGAVLEIETDVNSNGKTLRGFNADKSYIFTESRFGKFEFGNDIAANQKMKVGPSVFARAAGGINGKYLEYINLPMLADYSQTGVTATGTCGGYRVSNSLAITAVNSSGVASTTACANVKLPSFILIPQSPVAHGGYARSFYDRVSSASDGSSTGSQNYTISQYDTDYNSGGFNQGKPNYLWRDGSFGDLEDATKITYYTPRMAGWQLGGSFTPDTGDTGNSAVFSGSDSGDISNAMSWGVNYSDNFGNFGLALSATGEVGDFEQNSAATLQRNDLNAYEVGGMMTFFGFTIGGSYGMWGDSLQPTSGAYSCEYDSSVSLANQACVSSVYASSGGVVRKFGDSKYTTMGVAYQIGPVAASITQMISEFQSNGYEATSLGIDYRMAKGLMPYIEFTQFAFESNQSTASDANQSILSESQKQLKDNEGYVVLAGILFAF